MLLHKDGDILVGQYVFDTSSFPPTTPYYQGQDYDWLADLADIEEWCKIP